MPPNVSPSHHRTIRSFVIRGGRLTRGQQQALTQLWPEYGLAGQCDQPYDFTQLFGRAAATHLEIGFGNGATLLHAASHHPQHNYLGIEVHRPGIGHLLAQVAARQLCNVRVFDTDATVVLHHAIAEQSLQQIWLYFPDPWPKKKHHKRRLLQPAFANLLATKLVPGGELHFATDWADYGYWVRDLLGAVDGLENTAGPAQFNPRPPLRPRTKFEQRGLRLGHKVFDLVMRKG